MFSTDMAFSLGLFLSRNGAIAGLLTRVKRRGDFGWSSAICRAASRLVVLGAIGASGSVISAQTVDIKLVDGRNGRPMVGTSSYVNVWVGGERKDAITIPTDEKGVARLQLTLNPSEVNIPNRKNNGSVVVDHPVVKYDESFRINAPYVLCGSRGRGYSWLELKNFSTKGVLDHGYVSANTCGKASASPKPGEIVLYVRPLTWWEKLKH